MRRAREGCELHAATISLRAWEAVLAPNLASKLLNIDRAAHEGASKRVAIRRTIWNSGGADVGGLESRPRHRAAKSMNRDRTAR